MLWPAASHEPLRRSIVWTGQELKPCFIDVLEKKTVGAIGIEPAIPLPNDGALPVSFKKLFRPGFQLPATGQEGARKDWSELDCSSAYVQHIMKSGGFPSLFLFINISSR